MLKNKKYKSLCLYAHYFFTKDWWSIYKLFTCHFGSERGTILDIPCDSR